MISRIPIAHLHGGEATEGVIDEAIRHCITKMSHLHFVATEDYRNRVVQLGEDPQKVFGIIRYNQKVAPTHAAMALLILDFLYLEFYFCSKF